MRLRRAATAYIANECNDMLVSLYAGVGKSILLFSGVIAYAAVQASSFLNAATVALTILALGASVNGVRTVSVLIRKRPFRLGEQLAVAVAAIVAGTWVAYDLLDTAEGGLAWWRAVLEGAVLFAGISAALRLILAATSALVKRRRLRAHLDDHILNSLMLLRHQALEHRDEWGGVRSTEAVNGILENAAHAIESQLVNRLRGGRDLDRRRELKAKARGIAAALRANKNEVSRGGGADRIARFSGDAIAIVLPGRWLEFPDAAAPAAKPLYLRLSKLLLILLPLPAAVAAESLGLPVPGVTIVAALWLLVNLMYAVDKDHFAGALQATTSLSGTLKQFGGGAPDESTSEGESGAETS